MSLSHTTKCRLPVAIQDDPVDVTSPGIRFPSVLFGGIEIDVHSGTGGIVGIEYGFDGIVANELACNPCGNSFTCHISKLGVKKLSGIGAACAD